MSSPLQQFIHLLSTDQQFRHQAMTDLQSALARFELSEEERDILSDMHQMFAQSSRPVAGPDGPWGWQFTSTEPAAGSNGPWGWQFTSTEPAAGSNGPWGWQFTSTEPAAGPNGPWGWQFVSPQQDLQSS